MGFFDKLFKKQDSNKELVVYAPISGTLVELKDVPDSTFANKLLGDGLAVLPKENGVILSPIDGTLSQVFKTGHAFTVESSDGIGILVHFGMNTVELNGQGFKILAKEGSKVTKGQPIIEFDYNFIKEKVPSVVSPVVVLESEDKENLEILSNKDLIAGETPIIKIKK